MAVKMLETTEVSQRELVRHAADRTVTAARQTDASPPLFPPLQAALEHEVQMVQGLQHDNIVRYLGTERTGSTLCIFLEYVPGGSLRQLLERFGRFDEALVRVYTRQLLLGLEYLHRNGIAHRDIKGANILLGHDGTIKVGGGGGGLPPMHGCALLFLPCSPRLASALEQLADFGASKRMGNAASTAATGLKGTPLWMAPEVIRDQGGDPYVHEGRWWGSGWE